jgi:hypothetical protein
MTHLPHCYFRKIDGPHLFLKESDASLFLEKKMKCLSISSAQNQVLHYFFKQKSLFSYEEIMSRLIFSEEITRHFIFV